jgi:hypothetical protein
MIHTHKKKCKGTGPALGYGCGNPEYLHKYGLCTSCFKKWLFNSHEGKNYLERIRIRAKKKVEKKIRTEHKKEKEKLRSKSYYEGKLQNEINTIVRLIDTDKGCISCEHGWTGKATRQFHAGHRKSVGSNATLRFNLFNIFKQCSICNNFKSANEREYDKGIVKHYGQDMLDYIESLPGLYPELHLSIDDLKEKIIIARQIKKDILNGNDYTRKEINDKLSIYL